MDWERVNSWTSTLYSILYAMEIAHRDGFSEKDRISEIVISAADWIMPVLSINSPMLVNNFGKSKVNFRRDPGKNFQNNIKNIVRMLIQDLVVIFDEMMTEALDKLSLKSGHYPQSKVEKLYTIIDKKYEWSKNGCLELIAVRNALCHSGGRWNAKSIAIISGFVQPIPSIDEKILIGTPMLFRYRKAIRTFLNEVAKAF